MKSTSIIITALASALHCQAFQLQVSNERYLSSQITALQMTATTGSFDEKPTHFLMEEFTIHSGEIVNPYETLRVSRKAERTEIRQAYIRLSKRYHPDKVRHSTILPGRW